MKQGDNENQKNLMRYGHLLLLLQHLLRQKLITNEEARAIKEKIMKDYHVLSDYMA